MAKNMKYLLNESTGTLHIIGMCHYTKIMPYNYKTYISEDDAVKNNQRYMKNCKKCFKARD